MEPKDHFRMDSRGSKKRGLDCSSSLQDLSTAKRFADEASAVSPTTNPVVIKTERDNIAPTTESKPNSLSWCHKIDQVLNSYDNYLTVPSLKSADIFPLNSDSPAPRIKPERSINFPNPASEILSRLRSPGLDKNHPPDVVLQSYASVAKSLREAFVLKLTSDENLDADSVILLANAAFESLSQLEGDSTELYWAVRELIVLRHELSQAEKELESTELFKDTLARHDALGARSGEASDALISMVSSLEKLRKQVSEKKDLIRNLAEEVAKGDEEIGELEKEFGRVKEVVLAATLEQLNVAKQIEKESEISLQIRARRDEAKTGIERIKALLSSMLA